MNHSQIVSFLWGIADIIRDTFKRGKYQDVILPLTVLRRLDCVLAPTKQAVLETNARYHGKLDNDDKFMLHLAQVVRNGLGVRASTCIDPKTEMIGGKTVSLFSCQRSPEPVFLKWKGMEKDEAGDFHVRSGPGSVRL